MPHPALLAWVQHGFLVQWLSEFTPDGAVLLLLPAFLLIVLELNRPGLVLPGALGLLLVLLAGAALASHGLRPWPTLAVVLSSLILLLNLWRVLPAGLLVLSTVLLCLGLRFLVHGGGGDAVHTTAAVVTGSTLGGGGAILSRIALRARRAKALN